MAWIDDNKGAGPWEFTEQPDKWGYLNNLRWSSQADAVAFCEKHDLSLDLPNQHLPCGHWHKAGVSEIPIVAGKWVAAKPRPGTSYIYLYDVTYRAVIKLEVSTSKAPFIAEILLLDSVYNLDVDMGQGTPGINGAQRGGYCMNKSGTRIWYLFRDSDGDCTDCQLVEVDISGSTMNVVKRTLFPGLVANNECINDGCVSDTHIYWCTDLEAGRIIKIRNSDHSIIDDHYFNYPIIYDSFNTSIVSIDVNLSTSKLYWFYCRGDMPVHNGCQHLIRADLDLVADIDQVLCGSGFATPGWSNMLRIYSGNVLHHHAYHPFCGKLTKSDLAYTFDAYICQDYLQNIFDVKNNELFTLMHSSSVGLDTYLYCVNFSNMLEVSKLKVSYYTGSGYLMVYDWDAFSYVSAMNSGVIAMVRYHNIEKKNYVACFRADSGLSLLYDVGLNTMVPTGDQMISDEPQVWSMPA